MTDLKDLIAKCERATGRDLRLDGMIHATLFPDDFEEGDAAYYATYPVVNRADLRYLNSVSPRYTASIDAATALCERKCPSLVIHMTRLADGSGNFQVTEAWTADNEIVDSFYPMDPKPAALAIVLATLKALEKDNAE